MKKVIALISSLLVFVGSAPVYAGENIDSVDLWKTQQSRKLMNIESIHNAGITGKDQVVVVIDEGINLSSPAFTNKVIDGYCTSPVVCGDFYKKTGIVAGSNFKFPGVNEYPQHGSMVAGVAAGNKTSVFPGGIAPDAKIISINNNMGNHEGLLLAFDWIISIANKYNIVAVNASFGFPPGGDRYSADYCPKINDMNQRIQKLYDLNISVVAAAGNDGTYSTVTYPACNPLTVSVGATNEQGQIESYSNIGRELSVLAPATYAGVTGDGNGYWIGGGTSTATPVVVGTIALLKQVNPKLTVDQIKKALMSSDKYVNDIIYNNLPILNIESSVNAVKNNTFTNKTIGKNIITTTNTYEELSKTKTDLSTALSKINEMQNEINRLKNDLSVSNEKTVSQQTDSDLLKSEIEKLKNDVLNLKKVNTDLTRKNKSLCTILKRKSVFC